MDFYYYETYMIKILSRAFRYSFNKIGGLIQFVLSSILIIYYLAQMDSIGLGEAVVAAEILLLVFLFVFLMNLVQEFRWATPDIIVTARPELFSGGKIMVVVDIYNNEYDELKDCFLKLNKFVLNYPSLPSSTNLVPNHLLEQFVWLNGSEKLDIPSLECRTVSVAKENPKQQEDLNLGLCTNIERIFFPEQSVENKLNVILVNFEAEIRGKLGERVIFPKRVYGRIIFKKHLGIETTSLGALPPATWLNLEIIKPDEMAKVF
jgi:hypothetical protein